MSTQTKIASRVSPPHNERTAPPNWKQRWRSYAYAIITAEIQAITAYYDKVVYCRERPADHGELERQLAALDRFPEFSACDSISDLPENAPGPDERLAVILNGTFNYSYDVQRILEDLRPRLSRGSRLVIVAYNPYLRWLLAICNVLGIRSSPMPTTFLTRTALSHINALAGYQTVRLRHAVYIPFRLLGLGSLLNRWLGTVPYLRWLALCNIIVLRPIVSERTARPSLSIIIPARNEQGNIERVFREIPELDTSVELVLVEGHSRDDTWNEILKQAAAHRDRFEIVTARQTGIGKSDAVRLGIDLSSRSLIMIFDADLSVPPDLLPRFYEAYCAGLADFINGSRLVYPMEEGSMAFLNRMGNIFFAKALSLVLGVSISDSLCGTKLFSRADYERMKRWRADFGDFDPFGDFELLFPAAIFGLGIADVPIRYRARNYGSTNISRFRHGAMLLQMTLTGLFRVTAGRVHAK